MRPALPKWTVLIPIASLVLVAAAFLWPGQPVLLVAATAALIGSVLASVHHAEVVAHRVGEPFGTLILAVAVTVIEVALIVSMMLAGGPAAGERRRRVAPRAAADERARLAELRTAAGRAGRGDRPGQGTVAVD